MAVRTGRKTEIRPRISSIEAGGPPLPLPASPLRPRAICGPGGNLRKPAASCGKRSGRARSFAGALACLLAAGAIAFLLSSCENPIEAQRLASKSRALWESGRYEDAARNFVTLSELYPGTPLAQEALFWAANLYHHYLRNPALAARHYQRLIVTYPKSRYFYEAKENLAKLFEEDQESRHRALQIYQQLLLAEPYSKRQDELLYKIGSLNLRLGKMDQARLSFRDLLVGHAKSAYRAQAYYLVGFSYYLEKRYDLAIEVFKRTAQDFPGSPISARSTFFIGDTLEEQGKIRKALNTFRSLKGRYHNPNILNRRIQALQARIRRGVR